MGGSKSVVDCFYRIVFELYNLEDDPHEINNLANDPKHQELLKQLQTKLKAWQKKTRDPWILKWKYE